ncbi:phosphoribosylaminoimidazolesuccinocarboxamide synthase [Culicoidibacter larvae]|uniref:Phosphoribosylaminoimidazole-succinocarboxamide synthase n=1 Tax=Culicoidibacter larvae TaxID=2579976 RepID=A0A5R8QCV1_9FIRM|nr:phosphoribosylaminoimidazolesuccinocarboxamide synthase [Culicoidibacter larvae]TLG74332.1 phosphoribosylaminoimidazolesuccinocarboxamide synthase [Culicoidibacter larvae]
MRVNKMQMLYEGKAKQVYATNNPDLVIIHYKDDATAGNGVKKGTIHNKGILNAKMTAQLFTILEQRGVATHFVKQLNERELLCKKVEIFALEVIVRNVIAGSMSVRLGIAEGTVAESPIYEICYKNDDFGDPLINDHHAVALHLASYEQLATIYQMTDIINQQLKQMFAAMDITLVDFKIEFGMTLTGAIVLADEISPDTCRLWDANTHEKLDKDRFRRDLGGIEDAYIEIANRIQNYYLTVTKEMEA